MFEFILKLPVFLSAAFGHYSWKFAWLKIAARDGRGLDLVGLDLGFEVPLGELVGLGRLSDGLCWVRSSKIDPCPCMPLWEQPPDARWKELQARSETLFINFVTGCTKNRTVRVNQSLLYSPCLLPFPYFSSFPSQQPASRIDAFVTAKYDILFAFSFIIVGLLILHTFGHVTIDIAYHIRCVTE